MKISDKTLEISMLDLTTTAVVTTAITTITVRGSYLAASTNKATFLIKSFLNYFYFDYYL